MSIEALAMAGMDYAEAGIRMEEWEINGVLDQHSPDQIPLYLLADDDEQNFEYITTGAAAEEKERDNYKHGGY